MGDNIDGRGVDNGHAAASLHGLLIKYNVDIIVYNVSQSLLKVALKLNEIEKDCKELLIQDRDNGKV